MEQLVIVPISKRLLRPLKKDYWSAVRNSIILVKKYVWVKNPQFFVYRLSFGQSTELPVVCY